MMQQWFFGGFHSWGGGAGPPRRIRFLGPCGRSFPGGSGSPGPCGRNLPGGSGSLGHGAGTSQEGPAPWAVGPQPPRRVRLPGPWAVGPEPPRRLRGAGSFPGGGSGSLGRVVALGWLRIYEGAAFSWDFSEFRVRGVAKNDAKNTKTANSDT